MSNIIEVGGGSLIEFKAAYTEIEETKGKNVCWSQIFPVMQTGTSLKTAVGKDKILYEWVLGVHTYENVNKLFEKDTGKIKVDMSNEDEIKEELVEDKKEMKVII